MNRRPEGGDGAREEVRKYKLDKEMRSDQQESKTRLSTRTRSLFSPSVSSSSGRERFQTLKDFSGVFLEIKEQIWAELIKTTTWPSVTWGGKHTNR